METRVPAKMKSGSKCRQGKRNVRETREKVEDLLVVGHMPLGGGKEEERGGMGQVESAEGQKQKRWREGRGKRTKTTRQRQRGERR